MLELQERKKALSDGALGEGNGRKLKRLTVKDIANLFGLDAKVRGPRWRCPHCVLTSAQGNVKK